MFVIRLRGLQQNHLCTLRISKFVIAQAYLRSTPMRWSNEPNLVIILINKNRCAIFLYILIGYSCAELKVQIVSSK